MHQLTPTSSQRMQALDDGQANAAQSITITSSTTINTKGPWSTLKAGSDFAFEALLISVYATSTLVKDFTFDIGIDDGVGNVWVIAEDLHFTNNSNPAEMPSQFYLPVHVPAGANIVARNAATVASSTTRISVNGFSNGIGGVPGFSRCVALYTPSSSRGVSIDTGGTAHTKSAYTQLVASTPVAVSALMFNIGPAADFSRAQARFLLDIAIGSAGNEDELISNFLFTCYALGVDNIPSPPLPVSVPLGSRLSARAQSNGIIAGDRTFDISLWGFV